MLSYYIFLFYLHGFSPLPILDLPDVDFKKVPGLFKLNTSILLLLLGVKIIKTYMVRHGGYRMTGQY